MFGVSGKNAMQCSKRDILRRLIQARVARAKQCNCIRCNDLLSILHTSNTLCREHDGELRGLKFWSINWSQLGSLPVKFHAEPPALHENVDCQLCEEQVVDTLLEAEIKWKMANYQLCRGADSDEYWLEKFKAYKKQRENEKAAGGAQETICLPEEEAAIV